MEEKYWLALIKSDNNYYVMANRDKSIASEPTKEKFLDYFTSGYSLAQHRGIQGATASNLHNFTFNPRIIKMSLSEIENELFDLEKGIEFKIYRYSFGSMPLLKCDSKKDISKIFNKGSIPNFPLPGI